MKQKKKLNINMGIRGKIISIVLAISILSIMTLTFTNYKASRDVLLKSSLNYMDIITQESAKLLDSEVRRVFTMGESVAENPVIMDLNVSLEEKLPTLEGVKNHFGHLNMGIGDLNGNVTFIGGAKVNLGQEDFYKKALSGKNGVSSPRYAEALQQVAVTYGIPVFTDKTGSTVGSVIVFNRPPDEISKLLDNIKFLQTGAASMIDDNGTTIADKDQSLVESMFNVIEEAKSNEKLESLAELQKLMLSNESGSSEYTYNGERKIASYARLESTGWAICVTAAYSDIISSIVKVKNISIFMTLAIIIILGAAISIYVTKLTNSIHRIVDKLITISQGDFTTVIEDELIDRNDEIGTISKALDRLKKSIGSMIENIKDANNDISKDASGLYDFSQELTTASDNITIAISEVAEGNTSQSDQIGTIACETEEFSKKIDNMSEYTNTVKENTLKIENKADESKHTVDNLEKSVKKFDEEFEQFKGTVDELGSNMDKINSITRIIDDISEQTNLLALNAAIEAARAGEAGKGFAVVADEIRMLAEQSKSNSEQISEIIGRSYSSTTEIVNRANVISEELEIQNKNIADVKNSFDSIVVSVEEVLPELNKVYEGFTDVQRAEKEILMNIESASAVSEQVSASSEEILALSNELNKGNNNVMNASHKLTESVAKVMEQLDMFKVR